MSDPSPDGASPAHDLIYGIDDVPPPLQTVSLGLQQYLTMLGSTVVIPMVLADKLGIGDPLERAQLIGTIFFVSGIATLLQTTIGNRLPIVQGGTFSLLSPALALIGAMTVAEGTGWRPQMQQLQGAIIIGGLVEAVVGYSGLIGRLARFVGPITIAPTIALIGLALASIGAPKAGKHWPLGGLTIALIIAFSLYLRHRHRIFALFPVLLGIGAAWLLALGGSQLGWFAPGHPAHVGFGTLQAAPWVAVPTPFPWGPPRFEVFAIVGLLAGFVASMVESIGDYYACARMSGAPTPDSKTISRGIGMEGIGCVIAGVFGTGNGTTSYSENIGAIGLTRVGSRRVVQVGGALMIGLAVFGKFGAIFTTIPEPVVGALYCVMFGMITAVGLANLQHVDLRSTRNLFIVGFALYMGLSLPAYIGANRVDLGASWTLLADVLNTLGSSGMAVGAIIALVLDNTVPGTPEERGLTAWGLGPEPAAS